MITRRQIIVGAGVLTLDTSSVAHALEQCPGLGMPPGTCSAMLDPNQFATQQTAQFQKETQWCWAASISMICNWHGFPTSQERIVSEIYGGLVNMPGDDRVLAVALNHEWKSDDGRKFRISADVFSSALGQANVSNQKVIDDLKNNRPLLNGSRTHATVVARVDYVSGTNGQVSIGQVHVVDPFPGAAPPPFFARFLATDEMTPVQFGGSLRYLASIKVTAA